MKHKTRAFRRSLLRMTLMKKMLIGFSVTAVITWVSFRYLTLIPALCCLLLVAVLVWLLVDRLLIRPIQALTMAVLEIRPTERGFTYNPPDLHTGDELELLGDALRRMADDINHASDARRSREPAAEEAKPR